MPSMPVFRSGRSEARHRGTQVHALHGLMPNLRETELNVLIRQRELRHVSARQLAKSNLIKGPVGRLVPDTRLYKG